MNDPTPFVLARLDEVEAAALAATPGPWRQGDESPPRWDGDVVYRGDGDALFTEDEADAAHIARHEPLRVLREAAAKRALIAAVEEDPFDAMGAEGAYELLVLQSLACAWSDHPDFDPIWADDQRAT